MTDIDVQILFASWLDVVARLREEAPDRTGLYGHLLMVMFHRLKADQAKYDAEHPTQQNAFEKKLVQLGLATMVEHKSDEEHGCDGGACLIPTAAANAIKSPLAPVWDAILGLDAQMADFSN